VLRAALYCTVVRAINQAVCPYPVGSLLCLLPLLLTLEQPLQSSSSTPPLQLPPQHLVVACVHLSLICMTARQTIEWLCDGHTCDACVALLSMWLCQGAVHCVLWVEVSGVRAMSCSNKGCDCDGCDKPAAKCDMLQACQDALLENAESAAATQPHRHWQAHCTCCVLP
jgi:hypothetical protein